MSYPNYHPVYLHLEGRTILIVGGGKVAVEKLESLLPTGARITVVSPEIDPEIRAWLDEGMLEWRPKSFEESDVDAAYMIVAATDDPGVNARVFRAGEASQRLTNSVDDPANCNFIMAAITRSGPMQAAVSSAGCSPALAQRVRNRIAAEILTDELGQLAEFLGNRRAEVKSKLPTYKARQAFWESVIDSEIPDLLREQGEKPASDVFEACLDSFANPNSNSKPNPTGKVYLVGAGPGDPGLITVRATQVLAQADVVLYDRLVNTALLRYVKPGAERVYVGKVLGSPGGPRQKMIHERLIDYANQGKTVVRLKGGDPFVFGRGGEEAQALQEAGISWEVVPGVSSAIAVPAKANIPVSYRKTAPAFGVFAGQEAVDGDGIPWAAAALMPTAVFLMGVERLPHIVERLLAHGRSPDTPVAAISSGTLPNQRVATGTLADIASKAVGMGPPAVIIVGDVVRIGESLTSVANEDAV